METVKSKTHIYPTLTDEEYANSRLSIATHLLANFYSGRDIPLSELGNVLITAEDLIDLHLQRPVPTSYLVLTKGGT